MTMTVIRHSSRPELWEATEAVTREVWPAYNQHGAVLDRFWGRLFDDFRDFQFVLYDDDAHEVIAEGHTLPCVWDGTTDGLGDGIDWMLAAAVAAHDAGHQPNALCAMAAEIRPRFQGGGLSNRMLDVMADLAREAGFEYLVAPVRPSLKDRYPITPIERYVTWTTDTGEPFDPWIRVHVRRGAEIVKPVPRSMHIAGSIAQWEEWTGMRFPDDGQFTFPAGLAPVEIDHSRDVGLYWEPNVWIVHTLRP
jgi:GNAT superfamily N-acetyltransferase